jgi:hypothetical protein
LSSAQALPGVFAQIANAGIEGGAAPGLQRPIADLIELVGDGQHVVDAHARREQRLMSVAQDDVGDTERGVIGHG